MLKSHRCKALDTSRNLRFIWTVIILGFVVCSGLLFGYVKPVHISLQTLRDAPL